MKLPSVQQIVQEAGRTLQRYPFVLIVSAVGTVATIMIVEFESSAEPTTMFRVMFAALLGIPLLTGLTLFSEKRKWRKASAMGLQVVGVLLLAVYAWSLPENIPAAPAVHVIRLLMLATGLHLFVSVAPWLGRGEINGFWHFNKTLFLRLLTAVLFTHVLYAGLALALAAVENLFELHVPGERYGQLWILLTGMFMTWFFLAGVPDDLDALDTFDEYPKGLKIFSQYVLFPLIIVYLVILVAYSGKIIIEWSWPYGWVSRLILGFSSAAMFSLLLLHPIRERSGNEWIPAASRWFYISLAPLLVMYFLAVLRRLSEYGITEARYLAIVIGIWLAAMMLYFLFSQGKNIKIIPVTLFVLAFLISIGPWGAFAVSENSQVTRLSGILETNGILSNGGVHEAQAKVPVKDARQISAVLQYLHEVHGYGEIQSWFDKPLRLDSLGIDSEWKEPSMVAAMIGIDYVAVSRSRPGVDLTFNASRKDAMIVTGYDRVMQERFFSVERKDRTVESADASYSLNSTLDTLTFILALPVEAADTVLVPLGPVTDSLLVKYDDVGAGDVPMETMAVESAGSRVNVKVYVQRLQLKRKEGRLQTEAIRLRVLYGIAGERSKDRGNGQ